MIFIIEYINGDISGADADVIVNASNGCGYMGGKSSIKTLKRGVAESLNYHTKGLIEKHAGKVSRRYRFIPSFICGVPPGDIFATEPCGLKCKCVVHAVTMRYPGSKAKLETVQKLIPKILDFCTGNGYKSIALPLLGTGTGMLKRDEVMWIISTWVEYSDNKDIKILVFCNNK